MVIFKKCKYLKGLQQQIIQFKKEGGGGGGGRGSGRKRGVQRMFPCAMNQIFKLDGVREHAILYSAHGVARYLFVTPPQCQSA
jgi:hypothetical protein